MDLSGRTFQKAGSQGSSVGTAELNRQEEQQGRRGVVGSESAVREEQRAAVQKIPEDSGGFDGDCGAEVLCVERTLCCFMRCKLRRWRYSPHKILAGILAHQGAAPVDNGCRTKEHCSWVRVSPS